MKIRVAILTTFLAVVLGLLPLAPVLAGSGVSGQVDKDRPGTVSGSTESGLEFEISSNRVYVDEIRPGGTNAYSLRIKNDSGEAASFSLAVVDEYEGGVLDDGYEALPDTSWVGFKSSKVSDSGDAEPASTIEVDANTAEQVWVHLEIPRTEKWEGQTWQCWIEVTPVEDTETVTLRSALLVTTGDEKLPGGGANWGLIVVLVIVLVIVLAVVIVLASPKKKKVEDGPKSGDPPKVKDEPESGEPTPQAKTEDKEGWKTGLSTKDW